MKNMKSGTADDDRAEGVREFVRLVAMRFGADAENTGYEQTGEPMVM
jgi:hypothetical protein